MNALHVDIARMVFRDMKRSACIVEDEVDVKKWFIQPRKRVKEDYGAAPESKKKVNQ